MSEGDPSQKRPEVQLRQPRKIGVNQGDVLELVSTRGIVRVTLADTLNPQIDIERFTVERSTRQEAVVGLYKALDQYVPERFTELGTQDVTYEQVSYTAGAFANIQGVKDAISALLEFSGPEGKVRAAKNELREYLIGKGVTPEIHQGLPHPAVRRLVQELNGLVDKVQEEKEPPKRKRRKSN